MKRIFGIFVFASLLAVSCQKEMDNQNAAGAGNDRDLVYMEFTTQAEPTKTYIDDATKEVLWLKNDAVSIFPAGEANTTGGDKFTTQDNMTATATFTGESELAENYYALYPYKSNASVTEDGKITFAFPNWQAVKSGTIGNGYNPSVGVAQNGNLSLKNVGAAFKFTVPEDMTDLVEILVMGCKNENMAGTITVSATDPSDYTVVSGKNAVMINSSNKTNVIPPGVYYIAALPQTLPNGIIIKLSFADNTPDNSSDNPYCYMFTGQSVELVQNKVFAIKKIAKYKSFVMADFEEGGLPSFVTTINDSGSASGKILSVVENPHVTDANPSGSVFMSDMGKADWNTSGAITLKNYNTWFPDAGRKWFKTMRMKLWIGTNAYVPVVSINGTKKLPSRINGDEDGTLLTDEWNVVEYDSSLWGKSNYESVSSIELRPLSSTKDSNAPAEIDPVTNNKIVYYDDIEFLY